MFLAPTTAGEFLSCAYRSAERDRRRGSNVRETVSEQKTNLTDLQGFLIISRNQAAAPLLPEITISMPNETTQQADLQGKRRDGSDGTRTRDLRRDRPVMALPA
jgi:hypothetical protein